MKYKTQNKIFHIFDFSNINLHMFDVDDRQRHDVWFICTYGYCIVL